jgi:hypothetical protein
MIAHIKKRQGNILTIETLEQYAGKSNVIEIKEWSKSYDTYLKLSGLYHLFIKELSKETGDSELNWKHKLKIISSFGDVIWNAFSYQSDFVDWPFSYDSTTKEQRSELFKNSFMYVKENQIMDTVKFENDYFEITNNRLINY